MLINYAIHSSDSNQMYLDFWPVVSEIWKKKFSIVPVLIFIDDEDITVDNSYGIIIRLKPIKDIPIHLQTQIVRFWATTLFLNETSIICDIDMLPLSNDYFVDSIAKFPQESYIHLNPCFETYGRLPSCYHVAQGSTFKSVLDIDEDWEIFLKKILTNDKYAKNLGHDKYAWFADELYSTDKVLSYVDKKNIHFVKRKGGQNGFRLDRGNWIYSKMLLKADYYFDAHSIRPYSLYAEEIEKVKTITLNAKKKHLTKLLIVFVTLILKLKSKV